MFRHSPGKNGHDQVTVDVPPAEDEVRAAPLPAPAVSSHREPDPYMDGWLTYHVPRLLHGVGLRNLFTFLCALTALELLLASTGAPRWHELPHDAPHAICDAALRRPTWCPAARLQVEPASYWNYHLVMLLLSVYMSMLLTNGGQSNDDNSL